MTRSGAVAYLLDRSHLGLALALDLVAEQPPPTPPEPEEFELAPSAWDPEPEEDETDLPYEAVEPERCRALLLEIIRRAINDWVLYRGHRRLQLRIKADQAYVWLFEEKPGHAWWSLREREGRTFTSFLNLCAQLDLDPEYVRRKARTTTIRQIMTAGRPAERRKVNKDTVHISEYPLDDSEVSFGDLDALGSWGSPSEGGPLAF